MDIANASMYDGSTAMAEAVLMAERVTRRSKVIASSAIHPEYFEVAHTYVQHAGSSWRTPIIHRRLARHSRMR
jgi:glycine dehydrogenase subunit 1